ncbi:hemolysin family protein [Pseudogemmatithrix spongiicola]|uniref:Hemolysin family protein n=1 Tax=Pseudogemmatithrix spongiicola TaxID=3062599 RepID=A0AA49JXV6_9BACT|nr:hemolysin family protein [Gemmatimonadaceae bacterium 'strain 138']WKW14185.1 hemolysin family protein [Gemmatimonadaceae bacterium 'strain 318']
MEHILTESLVIFGLLLLNGVFAMSEIAVVTSRRARLETAAKLGSKGARRALRLIDDPTRFLSTVQIGITLIGVLAGAFGGATIAAQLDVRLEQIPALARFSEAIAVATVVGAISFLSLVFGELVPKRIAMQAPERIAATVAGPMLSLARVASPAVAVLTFTTATILRLLGIKEAQGTRVTEDEVRAVISEGRQSGAVQIVEHEMLEGVFRLGDRLARDVMVPRPDVDWIDVEEGIAGLRERLSRPEADTVLLCRGSLDEVVGVLRPQRVLSAALTGEPIDLVALAEPPEFVPGSLAVLRVLEQQRAAGHRAVVVLDEYGGVEGLLTLEHLLSEIVGDVREPGGAEPAAPWTQRPDGSWLVDGAADFGDVAVQLGLPAAPESERGMYRTLAGFVLARAGNVPRAGDAIEWGGFRLEVVDMDGRRVDKVLVSGRSRTEGEEEANGHEG